jgi:hypothetical protein
MELKSRRFALLAFLALVLLPGTVWASGRNAALQKSEAPHCRDAGKPFLDNCRDFNGLHLVASRC